MIKKKTTLSVLMKSICAGGVLGLACYSSTYAASAIPNAALALTLKSLIFPFGLIAIVFCGFMLYTGAVGTLPNERDMHLSRYFGTLCIIWLGNLIGAFACAFVMWAIVEPLPVFATIAETKCMTLPSVLIVSGAACNFLICLGIIEAKKITSYPGKAIILFISVFFFVICGFDHSIANMFYLIFGMFGGAKITFLQAFFYNLLPVTIGNFLGGAAFYLTNLLIKLEH